MSREEELEDIKEDILSPEDIGKRLKEGREKKRAKEEVFEEMAEKGIGCGKKIANVLNARDNESDLIIPLYRSAVKIKVLEDPKPMIKIEFFGDPHAWGKEEINEETVDDEGQEYIITGGRMVSNFYKKMGSKLEEMRIERAWLNLP